MDVRRRLGSVGLVALGKHRVAVQKLEDTELRVNGMGTNQDPYSVYIFLHNRRLPSDTCRVLGGRADKKRSVL